MVVRANVKGKGLTKLKNYLDFSGHLEDSVRRQKRTVTSSLNNRSGMVFVVTIWVDTICGAYTRGTRDLRC